MAVTWYEDNCPHCGIKNWVYNGDPTDQTVEDCGSLIRCHKCGKPFDMSGEMQPDDIDPDDCEDGVATPHF